MPPQAWPADAVERRPIDDLAPSARNARTHSEAQVAQIAASMREWGWTNPVLIDEADTIIAGHGRVLAARSLIDAGLQGFEDVPVMVARGWTDEQRQAYMIADNKIPMHADWNVAMLTGELTELQASDFDISLLGFTEAELTNLLSPVSDLDRSAEWGGMPEYEQENQQAFRSVLVNFRNQQDVDAFAELLEQYLSEKTRSLWFPANVIERAADKRYLADEHRCGVKGFADSGDHCPACSRDES